MSNKHKVVRSNKPSFNATTPLTYGSFMEEACVHNNCLDHLFGKYYMLTEDEANDYHKIEDEQANEEASIKTSPGNGLTPFPTPPKIKPLSGDQRESRESFLTRNDDDENKVKARLKQAAGTSSTVFATAAVKRIESSTRIFINKKTLLCDTHQERNFHMELWLFLTEGLPKTLMRDIIIGDINAIYMRIMALGQTNAVATRRYLHNQLNNIQKDSLSWPNYLHRFYELCDNLAAIGAVNEEEDLLGCLINGLQKDLRYKEIIRKIECARNPYSLQKAIDVITANAVNIKDNDLFQATSVTVNNVEANRKPSGKDRQRIAKSTESEAEACRNHLNGKPCHSTPCPYTHSEKNSSGTSQTTGASPKPQAQPQKSKPPCKFLVQNNRCKYGQDCHFSHDQTLVEEARQANFAGNLETEDYFVEAMCIEPAAEDYMAQQLQTSVVHKTPRNSKEEFRNTQGSPCDYLRKWDFAVISADSEDTLVQDGQSNLDHLDVSDAHAEFFGPTPSQSKKLNTLEALPFWWSHQLVSPVTSSFLGRTKDGINSFHTLALMSSPGSPYIEFSLTSTKVTRQMTSPPENSTSSLGEPLLSTMGPIAVRDDSQMIQPTVFPASAPDVFYHHLAQMPSSVLDTGASAHCFPLNEYFLQAAVPGSLIDCNVIMKTAKEGEYLTATKKADFLLKSTAKPKSPGVTPTVLLRQALLSSSFRRGLISATALTADGLSLQFEGNKCTLFNEAGEICMQVSRSDVSLYEVPHDLFVPHHLPELNLTLQLAEANLARSYSVQSTRTWHERPGHNSATRLAGLHAEKGLKLISNHDDYIDCTQAKLHRAAYPKTSNFRTEFTGQSFSVDYVGLLRVKLKSELSKSLDFKHAEEHGQLEEETQLKVRSSSSSNLPPDVTTLPKDTVDSDTGVNQSVNTDPTADSQFTAPLPTQLQTTDVEQVNKPLSFKQTNFEESKKLGTGNQLPPAIEFATLIRKVVMQDAYSATALSTDQVIPTLFVNRAKGDAAGRLANIKSRLTLRGDLDPSPAGITRRTCFSKFIRATTSNETTQFHKAPSPQKLPCQFLTLLGLHGMVSPSPIDLTGYAPKFTLRVMENVTYCLLVLLWPTRIWLTDDLIDRYGYSQLIVTHSSAESKLMALDALVRQVQNFHWFLESLQLPVNGPSIVNMDVLSETEHALPRKSSLRRQQQAANLDDNLGRRPHKRAKPSLLKQLDDVPPTPTVSSAQSQLQATDVLPIPVSIAAEALSPDSDSDDMESPEDESDHIDNSGPPAASLYTSSDFERYTWTQPRSSRPPLAAPPVPPAAPAPIEPTLPGTDYADGLTTETNADSDYGAGLSSAADDDDSESDENDEMASLRAIKNFLVETATYNKKTDPEMQFQYEAAMPKHLENNTNTNYQAQACRPQVDGQSAARYNDDAQRPKAISANILNAARHHYASKIAHNNDDFDSDVTVRQAHRTQVNSQSATLNDDNANLSSVEDDYDSEAEEANDEMEALIAIRDFLRETAALRRNEAPTT
jgi:hypothetical protein